MASARRIVLTHNRPEEDYRIDLHATTSTFAAAVSAAVAGQTIGLASGAYGSFTGTNKAITIRAKRDAVITMSLSLATGDSDFTIDGGRTEIYQSVQGMKRKSLPEYWSRYGILLTGVGFTGAPGPTNITIKRCKLGPDSSFTGGYIEFNGPTNTNIVIDRCWFESLSGGEAAIRAQDHSSTDLTIKNCFFNNLTADGVKLDTEDVTVQDCEFLECNPHGTAEHSDCVQFQTSASNITLVRNLFVDFEQAIGCFDGMGSSTITDNAIDAGTTAAAHYLTLGGDNPASTASHNTVIGNVIFTGPNILCGSKPGDPLSISNIINNVGEVILAGIAGGTAGSPTSNTHNMWSGAGSPNLSGTPAYRGGTHPKTWMGFQLTSGSAGAGAANDGKDVGIRIA